MRVLLQTSFAILATVLIFTSADARKPSYDDPVPWDSIAASEWEIAPDSAKEIHSGAVIFERVEADDQKMMDDQHYLTIYRRVRVLNEEGKSWADVEVPYYHREQKLLGVQARSVQRSGDTASLDLEQIRVKQTLKSDKFKVNIYSFSIPGVTNDCIIEWRIKLKMPVQYSYWAIQKSIPLMQGELRWKINRTSTNNWLLALLYPTGLQPYYIAQNLDKPVNVQRLPSLKDLKELYFTITDVPPFKEEVYSLPQKALEGNLHLYYSGSTSPAAFWGSIAGGIPRWLEAYIGPGKHIKKVVAQFDSLTTPDAKAEAAYYWLQDSVLNLSYRSDADTSKELKDTESAAEAIKKRRADDDDINRIYCDMLRTMDIDAKMAYALDRTENLLVEEAMYWQFDQTLVAIPDSLGGFKFVSPGHKYLPFGSAPWYVEGISALVGGGTTMFQTIPFSTSGSSKTSSVLNLDLTEELNLTGTLSETRTGHRARGIRIDCFDAGSADASRVIRDKLRDRYTHFEIDSVVCENLEAANKPLKVAAKLTTSQPVGDLVGQRLLIRPVELLEKSENPFTADTRVHPVIMSYPFETTDAIQIAFSAEWTVDALPADTVFESGLGSCGLHVTTFDGHVAIQRVFKLYTPFVPLEQYAELQKLYSARQAQSAATVSLVKAGS